MIDKIGWRSKIVENDWQICRVARRALDANNNKSYKPFLFNIISVIFDILPFQFGQSLLLYIYLQQNHTISTLFISFISFIFDVIW